MSLTTTLTHHTTAEAVSAGVLPRVSGFPSAELVESAAALFPREVVPDEVFSTDAGVRGDTRDSRMREGVRWRIEVAPGVLAVRSRDYVRAERAAERALDRRRRDVEDLAAAVDAAGLPDVVPGRPRVAGWSAKSRARMVQRLATLDYAPLLAAEGRMALVTLTYPGDWLAVAASSAVAAAHVKALRKRFHRAFGVPMVGTWKREFQRRGAPHYHLVIVVPPMPERVSLTSDGQTFKLAGLTFRHWLALSWADIVGAQGAERERHVLAGTAVDFAEASRMTDVRRLAVYFSKHGSYAAKEYQNEPPAEWLADGVGRFWGFWGLSPAVSAVEVAADTAQLAVRTLRRHSRANRYYASKRVWRKVTTVDRESGEIGFKWRRRSVKVPVVRLAGGQRAGFVVANDAASLAASVAAYVDQAHRPRRGSGPVGFLP